MIIVDANLLLYAYSAASPHHEKARAWLEAVLSGDEPVGIPWQTVAAFVRISTDVRIPGFRRSVDEVLHTVDEWLDQRLCDYLCRVNSSGRSSEGWWLQDKLLALW